MKYTRAIDSNELFARQRTPHVYPLFKLHKISLEEALLINPINVASEIPSRLVVGMKGCQMARVQGWLEHFLTPLSRHYGEFEYIKDSNDFLIGIENIHCVSKTENWNWDNMTIFTIDVKALYPSIKFEHLRTGLVKCFKTCTDWNDNIIDTLLELIFYTLQNQQITWNGQYFIFTQGIVTGGKHSVPLSNIFLSFLILDLLESDANFRVMFNDIIKLWKRFIDDCAGIMKGDIQRFIQFFTQLNNH